MSKPLNALIDAALVALAKRQDQLESCRRSLTAAQDAFNVQRDLVNQAQAELEGLFDQVRAQGAAGTRWHEDRPVALAPARPSVFLFYDGHKPSAHFLDRFAKHLGLPRYGYLAAGVPLSYENNSNSLLAVKAVDANARAQGLIGGYKGYTEKEARQLLGLEATTPAVEPEK